MSFDSSCCFLFFHLHYYLGCQYVKGTKQILIAVCVVEFTGSHSNFLVCKLQFYTVNFTIFFSVNVFTVFLYFLQNYSANHSCQNYFVKTTEFFYSVVWGTSPSTRHLPHSLWRINNWLMIWMCFTVDLKRPDWHPAPTLICTLHIHLPPLQPPPSLPQHSTCV